MYPNRHPVSGEKWTRWGSVLSYYYLQRNMKWTWLAIFIDPLCVNGRVCVTRPSSPCVRGTGRGVGKVCCRAGARDVYWGTFLMHSAKDLGHNLCILGVCACVSGPPHPWAAVQVHSGWVLWQDQGGIQLSPGAVPQVYIFVYGKYTKACLRNHHNNVPVLHYASKTTCVTGPFVLSRGGNVHGRKDVVGCLWIIYAQAVPQMHWWGWLAAMYITSGWCALS